MSKKKTRKPGKQVTAPPPREAADGDPAAPVPENSNVESDAPAAPRRSIEADEDGTGGDVERAGQ